VTYPRLVATVLVAACIAVFNPNDYFLRFLFALMGMMVYIAVLILINEADDGP
jgi:zinc transporter ZupT